MEKGLENEVKALKKMGFTTEDIAMKGIGYKECCGAKRSLRVPLRTFRVW